MRYLGGKSKLAKPIVAAISKQIGDAPVWEPFCGGLAVTVELAKTRRIVVATDKHPALVSTWRACQSGWTPPTTVDRETYEACKALPDTDPMKGFVGFGASFGGKWFGGYASGGGRNHAAESARNVCQQFEVLRRPGVRFERCDFLAVAPTSALGAHIYADPPYADTTRYKGSGAFDSTAFWRKCLDWRACGIRVFVSEFTCPVSHVVLWAKDRALSVDKTIPTVTATERLYELL